MVTVVFSEWLDELRELPSSAPQWENASQFIEDAREIIKQKDRERTRLAKLVEVVANITEEFSNELRFLDQHVNIPSTYAAVPPSSGQNALDAANELKEALEDFRRDREISFELLQEAAGRVQQSVLSLNELLTVLDESSADTKAVSNMERPTGDLIEESETLRSDETAQCEDSPRSEPPSHLDAKGRSKTQQEEAPEVVLDEDRQVGETIEHTFSEDIQVVSTADDSVSELPDGNEPASEGDGEPCSDGVKTPEPDDERCYGIAASSETAVRFLETPSMRNLEILMWSLVAEDDLAAAYWVSEHLSEQDYRTVVSPALLRAVQGSRWLAPESNRFVLDLFNFVNEYDDAEVSRAQGLLEFAASLRSSLIAPHSSMLGLLKTPVACPAANPFVSAIGEFARTGNALRPEYIRGMGESAHRQHEISDASIEARVWLENAPKRKYSNMMWATNVWKYLTGTSGIITEMLGPVIEDRQSHLKEVREAVSNLTQDIATDEINRINRLLGEGKTPRAPITGGARNWLLNGIAEASELAERWCELVEYERDVQANARDRYLIERVNELRIEIRSHSDRVIQALQELTTHSNPMDIASAAQCALRSVVQVLDSLNIDVSLDIPETPRVVREVRVINQDAGNLSVGVTRRLVWTSSIEIGDNGIWAGEALDVAVASLVKSISHSMSLQGAIKRRLDIQDYRFYDAMRRGIASEEREAFDDLNRRAQQDSRITLERRIEDVKVKVQQAVRDGVLDIDDDNWIMYRLVISEVENSLKSEEQILNYPPRYLQLEDIEKGIESEESARQAQLQSEWNNATTVLSDTTSPALKSWRHKFETAQESGNIRVMEECVIRLRNHTIGEPLPEPSSTDELFDQERNPVSEFTTFVNRIPNVEEYARTSNGLASLQAQLDAID